LEGNNTEGGKRRMWVRLRIIEAAAEKPAEIAWLEVDEGNGGVGLAGQKAGLGRKRKKGKRKLGRGLGWAEDEKRVWAAEKSEKKRFRNLAVVFRV
jgi:hypothetical protein